VGFVAAMREKGLESERTGSFPLVRIHTPVYDVAMKGILIGVLCCGEGSIVRLWDAITGKEVRKPDGHRAQPGSSMM
jgi:hypothetical protein